MLGNIDASAAGVRQMMGTAKANAAQARALLGNPANPWYGFVGEDFSNKHMAAAGVKDGKIVFTPYQQRINTGNADRVSYVDIGWENPEWIQQQAAAGKISQDANGQFLVDPSIANDPNFGIKQTGSYRGANTNRSGIPGVDKDFLNFLGTSAGLILGADQLINGGMFSGAPTAADGVTAISEAAPIQTIDLTALQDLGINTTGITSAADVSSALAAYQAANPGMLTNSPSGSSNLFNSGTQAPVSTGTPTPNPNYSPTTGLFNNATELGSAAMDWTDFIKPGLDLVGGLLSGNSAKDAASTSADAQIRAAQIAAEAAKFKPVGVTTNFGKSQFGYDAKGNLTSAGYQLNPQLQAQQSSLMSASNPLLAQFMASQGQTAPMGQSAQTLFNLGQGYLSGSPQEQAKKYYDDQMKLLQPGNERSLNELRNTLMQQGRLGLATGGTSTMAASNPEMEAYYNAVLQQQNQLAADSTQGAMDYAKFGAGMVGAGGDMLNSMYSTQSNAFQPYLTALGGAQQIEGLGQNAMDLGINLGAKGAAAGGNAGQFLQTGLTNAARTMEPANAYNPWAALLTGAGKVFDANSGRSL